jgi:hypothetical protein
MLLIVSEQGTVQLPTLHMFNHEGLQVGPFALYLSPAFTPHAATGFGGWKKFLAYGLNSNQNAN